jgi:hypothetical protein
MFRMAFVIGVIDTFHRFTVNADGLAGMDHGTFKGIRSLFSLTEALTAGAVTTAGMGSTHHNIPLAAQMLLIIAAVFHCAF